MPARIDFGRKVEELRNAISLRIGHSPDPDDAFMFYALTHGRIETGSYRFTHHIEDIQSLNERAMRGELEITAVSLHAYAYVADRYALLNCGASMGKGYGPIVVAREAIPPDELAGLLVAVPGRLTTAFLAYCLFTRMPCKGGPPSAPLRTSMWPPTENGAPTEDAEPTQGRPYMEVPFDQILQHVAGGRADLGLIIHEGQLTFADYGLHKVVDLGEWWLSETGLPLPLGVNVIRRDLGDEVLSDVPPILAASIDYALEHREECLQYALEYGRGLDIERADEFVGMYVNEYTRDMGEEGREAVRVLLEHAHRAGIIPEVPHLDFLG